VLNKETGELEPKRTWREWAASRLFSDHMGPRETAAYHPNWQQYRFDDDD